MIFVKFCVGLVIFLITLLGSGVFGTLIAWLNDLSNSDDWPYNAWFISSLGFTICFTILLYQNGVIK